MSDSGAHTAAADQFCSLNGKPDGAGGKHFRRHQYRLRTRYAMKTTQTVQIERELFEDMIAHMELLNSIVTVLFRQALAEKTL